MKKNQSVLTARLVTATAAAAMTISAFSVPLQALAQENTQIAQQAETKLVNIASQCSISVPSSENGRAPENMTDGDPATLWVNNGAKWPCDIQFALPVENAGAVKKVVVKFESGHSQWGVDLKLAHVVNSVVQDPITDNIKTIGYDDGYEYVYESPVNVSHINLELSNPTNNGEPGGFWPAIAEVEIWAEDTGVEETDFINVAPNASITSVGGNAGNKSNLVDENYSTLYVFNNGGISTIEGDAWIELALDREYEVSSLEAAVEKMANDPYSFRFTFDIYGKNRKQTEWNLLFEGVEATRAEGENIVTLPFEDAVLLSDVRIVVRSIESTGGDPWPALAEFKIMAKQSSSEDSDEGNIAFKKPVHSNVSNASLSRVNDGSLFNTWSGERYPAYIDVDLEENYNLENVEIYLPTTGYSHYSIYTSMDGSNFDLKAAKTDDASCPAEGDIYDLSGTEARFVRLYVEYQSTSNRSMVNEIRVTGTPSGTPIQEAAPVVVSDFEDSEYNVEITEADTIEEVRGIVSRRLGEQYNDWFDFSIKESVSGHDEFDLTMNNGKVSISGPNGISLATGLNHYLKYFCQVNISQVGDQPVMPEVMPVITEAVHRETPLDVRYSYNFCTLSYSMAFYGEEEWRNELDWLALNGVNVVLDMTGEEEVWRRFLGSLGYTHQEIKDFIAGPAYYAWFYMQNMSGFGGPVHDNWFETRTELARKNHLIMQKLGMQPALQGYCGMVPVDIAQKDPDVKIIGQGGWCSFQRPAMLKTDTASFDEYAEKFYAAQKAVFGDVTNYYATDPFHEGGNTGGMDVSVISKKVLGSMMDSDPDGVWIIQAWGSNPTPALIKGLQGNQDHALILDLYAEKLPRWNNTTSYGGKEFGGTPWVYCMLNNFGGRLGLHGHIENFRFGIAEAYNNSEHMTGIGITPEASVNNPVLYDIFFETAWTDGDTLEPIELNQWYKDYTTRRYSAESEAAYQATLILNDTVYNPALNMKGQGAPENVINARPAESISAASTWGNSVIDYDKAELEKALSLLLKDYDLLKDSEGYRYDLANVAQQVISNTAQEYHKKMANAIQSGNAEQFDLYSTRFLELIDFSEEILSTQKTFLLGTWTEAAKALADGTDDFTKNLYELNAKALVTTWGSLDQATSGGLADYSNRQWAGLTKDYYKPRWEKWIAEQKKRLNGESWKNYSQNDWFAMEWTWATDHTVYTNEPSSADLKVLSEKILSDYSVTNIPKDPAEDDSRDLPVSLYTAKTGSAQSGYASEGPASLALDGDTSTIWHSLWAGDVRENLWIELESEESQLTDGLRYLPRQSGTNGRITEYRVEISNDHGETWNTAAQGSWPNDGSWHLVSWEPAQATNVRLYAVNSITDSSRNLYAAAAEIRVTGGEETPSETVNKILLEQAVAYAEEKMTPEALDKLHPAVRTELEAALEEARAILADETAAQAEVTASWLRLSAAIQKLNFTADKSALQELVESCLLLDLSHYEDDENKAEFTAALADAQEVLANESALDETSIQPAYERLLAARNALNEKPAEEIDLSLLQLLIAESEKIDQTRYLTAGLDAFNEALIQAKAVEAAPESQSQVDTAAAALHQAFLNLRLKADESLLESLRQLKTELQMQMRYAPVLLQNQCVNYLNDLDGYLALGEPEASAGETLLAQGKELLEQIGLTKPDETDKKPDVIQKPEESQKPGNAVSQESVRPDTPAAESSVSAGASAVKQSVKTAASTGITAVLGAAAAPLAGLLLRKRSRKDS